MQAELTKDRVDAGDFLDGNGFAWAKHVLSVIGDASLEEVNQ